MLRVAADELLVIGAASVEVTGRRYRLASERRSDGHERHRPRACWRAWTTWLSTPGADGPAALTTTRAVTTCVGGWLLLLVLVIYGPVLIGALSAAATGVKVEPREMTQNVELPKAPK